MEPSRAAHEIASVIKAETWHFWNSNVEFQSTIKHNLPKKQTIHHVPQMDLFDPGKGPDWFVPSSSMYRYGRWFGKHHRQYLPWVVLGIHKPQLFAIVSLHPKTKLKSSELIVFAPSQAKLTPDPIEMPNTFICYCRTTFSEPKRWGWWHSKYIQIQQHVWTGGL
jgi:hypothetical protein